MDQWGTNRFVRSTDNCRWIHEGDLPRHKVQALYVRIECGGLREKPGQEAERRKGIWVTRILSGLLRWFGATNVIRLDKARRLRASDLT